jgi:hypothetical protein
MPPATIEAKMIAKSFCIQRENTIAERHRRPRVRRGCAAVAS